MHRLLSALRVQTRGSLRRLAHFLRPSERLLSDPRLGFVCEEIRSLDNLPATPPRRPEESSTPARGRGAGGVVEVSHPWPEWVQLMEHLLRKGYLDRSALRVGDASSSSSLSASKDSNLIRTACLYFARYRYLSRRDIHIIGQCGCPSIDRKVVNSGKRLRAHVGIPEGDVSAELFLRDQNYEVGRTVDVMRILLTYGLDIITGCNYINFRKNSVCLRCAWKRPKAINNGDFVRSEHDSQIDNRSHSFSFVRDSDIDAKKLMTQKEDSDFWRSSEDECSDYGDDRSNLWKGFNDFPIIGGRTAISQDATARRRWKEKMSKRCLDPSGECVEESDHDVASVTPSSDMDLDMDVDNCSSEDDTAEWFGSGKLSGRFPKSSV
ncbi:hypothetical protein B296_00018790 [Ensete ventricosum]|uniref:Uncharacterized protein n=1 Tax=Ensete ventricosum TaxID=4639 RepID=A0A427A0U4_ENSVE|nr:hypothetical protein B296_00018790 [Ensete ventricosum]